MHYKDENAPCVEKKAARMLVSTSSPFEESSTTIPSEAQIRHDVAYINSMLTKLGMECPLAVLELPDEMKTGGEQEWGSRRRWELGQACAVMIPLLTTKVREQAFRSEVEDRVRRLAEDLQDRTTQLSKQEKKSSDLERQVQCLTEELKQSQKKCRELEGGLARSKEETGRLRTSFQLKEKQFLHELRKREHDFDRLKEQLQTHFNREILGGSATDRAELARLSVAPNCNSRLSIYGEMMEDDGGDEEGSKATEDIVDRLTGLETENETMRSLLLSISQLLTELKHVLELDDEGEEGRVQEAAVNALPSEWVLEQLKEEIEGSLELLSKRVAHICGIPL